MQHILVYADSLSWGIVPTTRRRLLFEQRWPGVMEISLCSSGQKVRVVEDCLNGRRTAWDDPFKPGRNGLVGLSAAYRAVCAEVGCHFFDAGSVVASSNVDGVHLDLDQHLTLGRTMAEVVKPLLLKNAL